MADPGTIANLTYRWRADSITGNSGAAVSSWPALTGGAALTQSTAANQPTLQLNALGGQPVVRFDGVNDFLSATVTSKAQPLTLSFVLKWNSVAALAELLDGAGLQVVITPGQYDFYAGNDIAGGAPSTSAPAVVTIVANGASAAAYVNGTQVASGNLGTAGLGTVLNLARHGSLGRYAGLDLAELLIYTQALSATDRATVHSYVQDRYGIKASDYVSSGGTVTPPPAPVQTFSASSFVANVKADFGAKGDGLTDDTAAFTNALNSGAGRVVVPTGTYVITSTLTVPSGVVLEGANKWGTILLHSFNGDQVNLSTYSALMQIRLEGQGTTYTGRGIVLANGTGQQVLSDVAVTNFDGACVYFGISGGSQFRGHRVDAYRVNAGTGTGRHAIVVESAFMDSAVPRSFVQLETHGTCAIDFGGCNDFYLMGSTFADLRFTDNTRGLNIVASRWMNQASATIFGHGVTIVGCDILPAVSIDASANMISVGPNSYNRPPVINNGANQVNIVMYPGA